MRDSKAKIRLYVDASLAGGQPVSLAGGQAHYLFAVMRLTTGDAVLVFNGRDGEWQARVGTAGKRSGTLVCDRPTAPQTLPPDLWLMFAPLKKSRTDLVVEKAVELGVARIVPVLTQYTNAERLRPDKLRAHAIEAAEQCGATHVPEIRPLRKLADWLSGWPENRRLIFCDENRTDPAMMTAIRPGAKRQPTAILIGPEGGFSPAETALIRSVPMAVAVALGPRILRADTAAVAALAIWQSTHGDWA